jgi:hypothetical protein
VATLNFAANELVDNSFAVGLGTDGGFKIFNQGEDPIIVDVTGAYVPAA